MQKENIKNGINCSQSKYFLRSNNRNVPCETSSCTRKLLNEFKQTKESSCKLNDNCKLKSKSTTTSNRYRKNRNKADLELLPIIRSQKKKIINPSAKGSDKNVLAESNDISPISRHLCDSNGYGKNLNVKVKFQRKNKKKTLNDSFQRYGRILPSYDKIMANINRLQEESEILDTFERQNESLDLSFTNNKFSKLDSSMNPAELLDCKHLGNEDLKKNFYDNLKYIKNILDGETYSERHNRYHKYDPKFNFTEKDLKYSSSFVAYSVDQMEYLLGLVEDEFFKGIMSNDYVMKVLLPELCLVIFMGVHDMTKEEAASYLDWRPVD